MADDFSKCQNSLCGVGGRKCRCCNQFFGKRRRLLNKLARTKLKKLSKKDIESEVFD